MTGPGPCLLCRSTDTAHYMDARDYITGEMFALRQCRQCGFVYVSPVPDDLNKYYPAFYRQYHPIVLWLFRFFQELRTRGWVRKFGTSGRVLEVGCGHGWMLAALRRCGWNAFGVERTAQSASFAGNRLGLRVLVGELTAIKDTAGFDLIILHEVLEHLREPMETLEACARLLRPGGTLIVEVPNLDSWQFQFTREHWEHLLVPRHIGQFTPETMRSALERVQLRMQDISYVSLEYDPHSWLQSTLNKMGFPQNLLLRWLAGGWRGDPERGLPAVWTLQGLAMVVMIALLIVPSFLLAMISWPAHKGSIMEVRAVRPKS